MQFAGHRSHTNEGGKRNVRAGTLLDLLQLLGYDVVLRRRGRQGR
jgi:hypothetical protein